MDKVTTVYPSGVLRFAAHHPPRGREGEVRLPGRSSTGAPAITEPGMWLPYDYGDGPVIDGAKTVLFVAWLAWSRFRVVIPLRDKTIPLLSEEAAGRERSALATRRSSAGFPTGKTFDAWDPSASSIPAPTQQALRTLEWVHRRENLVVCGPSGTGKTLLLEALGQQAVEVGHKVAWFTLEDLGVLLRRHRADDTVTKAIARVLRADLVIIDDIGLLPVATDAAEGLYRLVDAAYESARSRSG